MKHPIHTTIVKLIDSGRYSPLEISEKLKFNPRTLTRRKSDGEWRLHELIALEELYEIQLLNVNDRIVDGNKGQTWQAHDESGQYGNKGYHISIVIDPANFNPSNLDALNSELTEVLKQDYLKRNP